PVTASPGLDEAASILQRLERNARARRSRDELGHGEHLLNAFEQMRLTSWVNSHQPIAWPHWPKGVWAKAGALAQKVTRRLLAWYVAPIVEEQNQFNAAVERAFRALMDENTRLRTDLQALADDQPKRPDREPTTSSAWRRVGESKVQPVNSLLPGEGRGSPLLGEKSCCAGKSLSSP